MADLRVLAAQLDPGGPAVDEVPVWLAIELRLILAPQNERTDLFSYDLADEPV